LEVFQRTAPWVIQRRNRPVRPWQQRLYRTVPASQRLLRAGLFLAQESAAIGFLHPWLMGLPQALALRQLRHHVPDRQLRARLTPTYRLGCKRILLSDGYLPALNRDNVELVTEPIAGVEPSGIRTADGALHEVDTIVFATGFRVTDAPVAERIRGRDGATLAQTWQGSPRAYLGTTVSGFPNLFLLLGPNTGLGHTSVLLMIEAQLRYVTGALDHLATAGAAAIEPTARAQEDFVAAVDRRMAGTVWSAGGCRSWYQDANGRVSALWPGTTLRYRWRLRRFDPRAYRTVPANVSM
jgi:cation diffusion facilitator CzcD-associated flavoprotein CzcO